MGAIVGRRDRATPRQSRGRLLACALGLLLALAVPALPGAARPGAAVPRAAMPAAARPPTDRTPEAAAAVFASYVDRVLARRAPGRWQAARPGPRVVAVSGDPAAPDQVMIEVDGHLVTDGGTRRSTLGGTVAWQGGRWVSTGLRPAGPVPRVPDPRGRDVLTSYEAGAERGAARQRLLVVGDSISQGSSGDYTWRYRLWRKLRVTAPEVRFVGTTDLLYDHLRATYDSTNYAQPFDGDRHSARWGASLSGVVPSLGATVEPSRATVLVLALGINDVVFAGASPTDIEAMARRAVRKARAAAPGIDVVLCPPLSRHDFFTGEDAQVSASRAVARHLADLASAMDTRRQRVTVAPTRAGWDPEAHTYDGTHPNATGEAHLAQRVSEALARLGIGTRLPDVAGPTHWDQRPDAPTVTVGGDVPTDVTLTWDRAPTGATAMFLQHRAAGAGDWTTLPYPVGAEETWTYADLVPGTSYRFRIIPVKGWMVGTPSPGVAAEVPAAG